MPPNYHRFRLLDDIPHGVSTRHGGVSTGAYSSLNLGVMTEDSGDNIEANRRIAAAGLGFPVERVQFARLSHGNRVSLFRRDAPGDWPVRRGPVPGRTDRFDSAFLSDGVVSDVPGMAFLLTFADCVPVALTDRRLGIVGAAHAGWRGTALGVAFEVVRAMVAEYGSRPADIVAGIGPSVGPCCYDVGEIVRTTFAQQKREARTVRRRGKVFLDLWKTNESQLRDAGIPESNIESACVCTNCNRDTWFSHRGEGGITGRFAMLVGLPG